MPQVGPCKSSTTRPACRPVAPVPNPSSRGPPHPAQNRDFPAAWGCPIAATAGCLFLAADAYRGRREGFSFKLGGQGLGYYPDYNALEDAARELTEGDRIRIQRYHPPDIDPVPDPATTLLAHYATGADY